MTRQVLVTVTVIVVLVGGGSFYGGMKYAQSKTPQKSAQGNFQNGMANIGGFRNERTGTTGGGFTAGEIIAKDSSSVTVKLNNGGSKIVFYSDVTEVDKFAKGTAGDLQIGGSITVSGQANQDGSLTAHTIQIRPARSAAPAGQ